MVFQRAVSGCNHFSSPAFRFFEPPDVVTGGFFHSSSAVLGNPEELQESPGPSRPEILRSLDIWVLAKTFFGHFFQTFEPFASRLCQFSWKTFRDFVGTFSRLWAGGPRHFSDFVGLRTRRARESSSSGSEPYFGNQADPRSSPWQLLQQRCGLASQILKAKF